MIRRPPRSTLFPYTTTSSSSRGRGNVGGRPKLVPREATRVPPSSDPSVGTVGIPGLPHISVRFPHPPTRLVPRCWLQCGQLLARHFDAFLERPVTHHLPLYLVDRVDHGRVVPPPERLPDLDQLHEIGRASCRERV